MQQQPSLRPLSGWQMWNIQFCRTLLRAAHNTVVTDFFHGLSSQLGRRNSSHLYVLCKTLHNKFYFICYENIPFASQLFCSKLSAFTFPCCFQCFYLFLFIQFILLTFCFEMCGLCWEDNVHAWIKAVPAAADWQWFPSFCEAASDFQSYLGIFRHLAGPQV